MNRRASDDKLSPTGASTTLSVSRCSSARSEDGRISGNRSPYCDYEEELQMSGLNINEVMSYDKEAEEVMDNLLTASARVERERVRQARILMKKRADSKAKRQEDSTRASNLMEKLAHIEKTHEKHKEGQRNQLQTRLDERRIKSS